MKILFSFLFSLRAAISVNYKQFIFILLLIISLLLLFKDFIFDYSVIYCMDGMSEERLNLINKINKCKVDFAYYKDQVEAADTNLKELLKVRAQLPDQEFAERFTEAKSALDDSKTNLNAEQKALTFYENKLNTGNYNLDTYKTVQKRKAS